MTDVFGQKLWITPAGAVWLSAKRNTGRGEGSSGLAFDHLVDTPTESQ